MPLKEQLKQQVDIYGHIKQTNNDKKYKTTIY
jgi:hypothetical protein